MEKGQSQSLGEERAGGISEEEEQRLKSVMDIFSRLYIACKSRTLYSADHPAAADAVVLLHAVMEESLRNNPRVTVKVGRDSLIYDRWVVGQRMESLRTLASRIRSLNIQEIAISAGASLQEVGALVEMLVLSPEELEREGGAENALLAMGIHNVAVVESEAGRAGEEGGTEAGEGEGAGPGARERAGAGAGVATDIEAELMRTREGADLAEDLDPEQSEALLKLLLEPEALANTLMAISGEEEEALGGEELAGAAFTFLAGALRVVRQAHPEHEQECLRCMAESVLFLDMELRDTLLLDHLFPCLHEQPWCRQIMGSFNAQEMADLLSVLLPRRPELTPGTGDMLRTIGFREGEVRRALRLLRAKLVDLGQVPPSLVARLTDNGDEDPGKRSGRERLPSLEEVAGVLGEYRPEELNDIRSISRFDPAMDALTDTTPMLIDLLRRGSSLDNSMKAVELLQNNLWGLAMSAKLDTAALALEGVAEIARGGDTATEPFRSDLRRLLEEMAGAKVMGRVVQLACMRRDQPGTVHGLSRYVESLGERGIATVVQVLGSVEDMYIRKCLLDTLTELCRERVQLLGAYVDDGRWYLVRNIVSIMGRIHSPEAIPYLRRTLYHPNPKVRAETIRALGLTGGHKASELLMQGLQDGDENTRVLCIRWLGRLGETRAAPQLVKMLQGKEPGAESLGVKKEIIMSLGKINTPECYDVLRKYRTKQRRLGRAEWREVNEAADEALRHLTGRFPHLRRKR